MILRPVSRLLERRSLRRAVQRALESGTGLYRTSWLFEEPFHERIADDVIDWCRETVGKTHRPYGVGSVSVALAALGGGGHPHVTRHHPMLNPRDFYGGGLFEVDVRTTLLRWAEAGVLEQPQTRVSVVLFSWGDLTRELLLAG